MRIVHFADLHLDTPFKRLPPGAARARRQALRTTLDNILALARSERADAVFCAGDLFEADRLTHDTGHWLRDRFAGAGLSIYIAPGNHDWLGPTTPYGTLSWPANVHLFRSPALSRIELAPGIVLHGAAHHRPSGTGNLLAGLARQDLGAIHLALFHGSERGCFAYQGRDKGDHAPFEAQQIAAAGFSHAFLGHYHVPADELLFTYPGNPEPLSFGEAGAARGAVIVDIAPDGTITRRRRTVAVSDVHAVQVDLDGAAHRDAVLDRVRAELAGLSGAIRIRLRGHLPPDVDLDLARDLDPDALGIPRSPDRALLIESDELSFDYDLDRFMAEPGVRGELVRRTMSDSSIDPADRQLVLRLAMNALAGRDDLGVL
jgi:DNA repair exonuclease SbcCD nuclease subunit